MREALTRGNWDGVGTAIADEWQNRKRLAPGVTTPAIEQLIARATHGRRHRGQGLRRRRRRLPLLLRPARASSRDRRGAGRGRRHDPRLHIRAARAGAWITAPSRRCLARSPTCSRSRARTHSRFGRIDRRTRRSPHGRTPSPGSTISSFARSPASARTSRRASASSPSRERPRTTRSCSSEFPQTILELLRLQGVGPKTVALLYSALNIGSIDALAAAARDGRLRSIKGMGAKKEALILKAIEEREKDAGRHLLADTASVSAELVQLSTRARAGR